MCSTRSADQGHRAMIELQHQHPVLWGTSSIMMRVGRHNACHSPCARVALTAMCRACCPLVTTSSSHLPCSLSASYTRSACIHTCRQA
jgi:hypothetical protein